MKPKKVDKKLSLNKKTVADLNNHQQNNVKGGLPYTYHCCGTRGERFGTGTCPLFFPGR